MRYRYAMASVHKQNGKPNWFCAYYDDKGIRRFKTTGSSNKKEAEKICLGFQKASELGKAGRLSEDRARKVIESVVADIVESSGGLLKRYSVKDYFISWVKSREGTSSPSTHLRYTGIIDSFLNFLGEKRSVSLIALRSDDIQKYRDFLRDKVSSGTVNTRRGLQMTSRYEDGVRGLGSCEAILERNKAGDGQNTV